MEPEKPQRMLDSMLSEFDKVKVYLPDGRIFEKTGHWYGFVMTLDPETGEVIGAGVVMTDACGTILDLDKDLHIYDCRGVYVGDNGEVKFSPRDHRAFLPQFAKDWLDKNPHWPAILEL